MQLRIDGETARLIAEQGKKMKRILLLVAMVSVAGSVLARDVYVKPHVRKDGTFVQGHHRSAPDNNPHNNYGSQGNYNPYTGKQGTVDPYQQPSYHIKPHQIQQQPQYGQPGYCNPFIERC